MKKIIYSFFIFAIFIFANTSCSKESDVVIHASQSALNTRLAETHSIGEHFGGGIIFFVDETGKHGLIAAVADPEEPSAWSFKDTNNNAKATAIGKGYLNTKRIFQTQGAPVSEDYDYAASDCLVLLENSYQDWYLPSKNELNQLYKQKNIVGGFNTFAYWSSSEISVSKAWAQNFGNGLQTKQFKNSFYAVRPVRRF